MREGNGGGRGVHTSFNFLGHGGLTLVPNIVELGLTSARRVFSPDGCRVCGLGGHRGSSVERLRDP